jgi:hypothetical protein
VVGVARSGSLIGSCRLSRCAAESKADSSASSRILAQPEVHWLKLARTKVHSKRMLTSIGMVCVPRAYP